MAAYPVITEAATGGASIRGAVPSPVRIVVLMKPVPLSNQERLGSNLRVDRSGSAGVLNAADGYALEAALRLVDAWGGEVTILTMAPLTAAEAIRAALALGADRGVIVADDRLAGACIRSTVRVLAAALRTLEFDLVLAGAQTSDGDGGVVAAGVAGLLHLPYISSAAQVELVGDRVRVRRRTQDGSELLETPMAAVVGVGPTLGELRYPSLKGRMAARSKPLLYRSLAELSVNVGPVSTDVLGIQLVSSRDPARVIRAPADEAARQVVAFLSDRGAV